MTISFSLWLALAGPAAAQGLKVHATGDPLPHFSLRGEDGTCRSIEKIRGDRPMILSFFRKDCKPCQKELPHLQSLHQSHGERVAVVLILLDAEGHKAFEPYRKKHGVTFTVLHDAKRIVALRLGVKALPTIYLVDESGVIRETVKGFPMAKSDEFESIMLSKLGL